jgi:ELWxxDGT repeat protein
MDINSRIAYGNKMIFDAFPQDPSEDGVWVTDGTPAGTKRLTTAFGYGDFWSFKGRIYFFTRSPKDAALWTTDGTIAGTQIVKDGLFSLDPVAVTSNAFYFLVKTSDRLSLFKSDGTTAGTKSIKDLPYQPPEYFQDAFVMTAVGDRVYFSARDAAHGVELWTSFGGKTVLLKDINPGPDDSVESVITGSEDTVGALASVTITDGKQLYFTANDGKHGQELWKTDATPTGTKMIQDINPGSADARPADFLIHNQTLLFSANDGNGRELWELPLA